MSIIIRASNYSVESYLYSRSLSLTVSVDDRGKITGDRTGAPIFEVLAHGERYLLRSASEPLLANGHALSIGDTVLISTVGTITAADTRIRICCTSPLAEALAHKEIVGDDLLAFESEMALTVGFGALVRMFPVLPGRTTVGRGRSATVMLPGYARADVSLALERMGGELVLSPCEDALTLGGIPLGGRCSLLPSNSSSNSSTNRVTFSGGGCLELKSAPVA